MRATGKCLDDDCVKLNARHHISLPRPWARLHFNINMRQRKCVIFVSCALCQWQNKSNQNSNISAVEARGVHIFRMKHCLEHQILEMKKMISFIQMRSVSSWCICFSIECWQVQMFCLSWINNENWKLTPDWQSQQSMALWIPHNTQHHCLNRLIRTDFLFPRCGARSVCLTGNPRFIITVGTLFPRTKHTSSIAEKYVANGSSFTTHTQIDPITDDWLKVQPMRLPFHVLYHHEMATTSSASKWPSLLMNIEKHRHFSLETRAPVKEHVIISPAASFSTTVSKCSLTLAPEKESTSAKNSLCLKIETIFSPHYFPTIFFSSNQVSVCISVYAGSIPFFFQNIQPCIDREYDLNFN